LAGFLVEIERVSVVTLADSGAVTRDTLVMTSSVLIITRVIGCHTQTHTHTHTHSSGCGGVGHVVARSWVSTTWPSSVASNLTLSHTVQHTSLLISNTLVQRNVHI